MACAAESASELSALFSSIRFAPALRVVVLDVFPLLGDAGGPDADLLEEGLAQGLTSVEEVSEQGSVNQLRVSHRGQRPLLLIDGEQVLGAKQNRVFNASFLVPPNGVAVVPVSCVERGRRGGMTGRI